MQLLWRRMFFCGLIAIFGCLLEDNSILAQSTIPSNLVPSVPVRPEESPRRLPPVDQLLIPSSPQIEPNRKIPDSTTTFVVQEFRVIGSTVFSAEELAAVVKSFTNRPISFAELLQARAAIADLYIRNGYITSGAFIPPQETNNGNITIQVVEGKLEEIQITGTNRVAPNYIRSRLEIATGAPLNRDRLLNALQLLQLDPLFKFVSSELKTGSQLGTSILAVKVDEANSFNARASLDNYASPSVGQLSRQVEISDRNLLGLGDRIIATYGNTDGRNQYNLGYTLPVNAYNGTLSFLFSNTNSNVVESEFKILDIYSNSTTYELTFRQPLIQTPAQEFALGLTASHSDSFTTLLKLPIPLSAGSDDFGKTKLSALRFFQDYTQRSSEDVIALRSQISVGLRGVLNSTINLRSPDSGFVAWRGQLQYIRALAEDTLLIVSGSIQFADRALPAAEKFSLGGSQNGRGYRQDVLVGDNGMNVSLEARFPIVSVPELQGLLQIVPFIDVGSVWNQESSTTPANNWILGTGLGLRWQMGDRLTAKLDYGLPLISIRNNHQDSSIYFSLSYRLF
ncbi:ShlB/FhaC/HecB family hemolysin secretion/activation protein [Pseudanabaena sp. BC1403]|uniref:ShlB/FhaC/HecB family hemolysin secretion/activation protein n=1 Tax=Pseudanabaena sp. BC1403 TaxID=2043171 RepID=UPI000CD7F569|nr:ShlB/FhaC/HecB family hemolysin secretion/activation protein [Pseudanabaena sp. BC1403]